MDKCIDKVSSDCVIWQGQNLECVGIKQGDCLTETVSVLANKLCDMMSAVDINSYDLSCFIGDDCQSVSWEQLFQLMIDKVCFLEGSTPTTSEPSEDDCPEDLVLVPDCFSDNCNGGAIPYTEYVKLIGTEICLLINEISTINETLIDHAARIKELEEGGTGDCAIPQIVPTCVGPSVLTDVDEVIQSLEESYCTYQNALGDVTELTNAVSQQCPNLSTSNALNSPGTMGQISGWNQNPTSVADSLSNLWLTLCDMRGAMAELQECCAEQ